jgi:hypothetical protein
VSAVPANLAGKAPGLSDTLSGPAPHLAGVRHGKRTGQGCPTLLWERVSDTCPSEVTNV